MSYIVALVAIFALLFAVLRGRSIDDLVSRHFAWWGLLVGGVALHAAIGQPTLGDRLGVSVFGLPICLGAALYLASLTLLIVFLLRNLGCPGFVVVLLGLALNLAVIALNEGRMPADPSQLAAAGILDVIKASQATGVWSPYGLIDPATPLAWLGDRIFVPLPFHEPVIVSIGDLFVLIGLFLFFNATPSRRRYRFTSRAFTSRGW